MRLVLLGPPGGGKGTQAKTLAVELNVPHIATGDLFRAEIAAQTELGKLADSFISHGNLVPDDVVNRMVRERLGKPDCSGFVLDGYPRTVPQAEALESALAGFGRPLQAAIEIDVPDDSIVERAVGRQICPACDAIYHLTAKPPRRLGICDNDGTPLIVREDDQPSTVRRRLQIYHRITEPVLEFYEQRHLLRKIDGLGKPNEVGKRLRAIIGDLC
jgi:adenylate kinase